MTDARALTARLHGKWHQSYGTAPCPVCQRSARRDQDALTIGTGRDGRLLAHCKKSGCDFADILAAAGVDAERAFEPDPLAAIEAERQRKAEAVKRGKQALVIWRGAVPIEGTLAEIYLRGRGIRGDIPPTLRFHPECWHGPSARRLPAMVGAVAIDRDLVGVHRTFLIEPGRKIAGSAKLMLGSCAGGAVRLSGGPGPLIVAEGIETALSLLDGLRGHRPRVWAALSTSGMAGLRLPPSPGELALAPDGDPPGRAAADKLARRAWAAGWRARIMTCPEGADWNDIEGAMA